MRVGTWLGAPTDRSGNRSLPGLSDQLDPAFKPVHHANTQPMKRILFSLLLLPLLGGSLFCHAAEPEPLPSKDRFHLFLLVGQSNMAGRGVVADEDRTAHPRVLMLNQAGEWVPAIDPMHFDKPIAGVGLGKTFGQIIADTKLC